MSVSDIIDRIQESLRPKLTTASERNEVCYRIDHRGRGMTIKVQVHFSEPGTGDPNYAKVSVNGRGARISLPPWPPEDCVVQCDEECEYGTMHCADIHEPLHKKRHDGQQCPDIHICGIGEEYMCCTP